MSPRLQARVRPLLKANAFLGRLPDAALDTIIQRGQARTYAKGEFAFRRGDPGDRLMLLVTGGIAVPLDRFPDAVRSVLELLPAAALAEGLRDCLSDGAGLPVGPLLVLLVWGAVGAVLATRWFRWE